MFLPRNEPIELTPEQLLEFRQSLNTPVVAIQELPMGPARALLAVYRDAAGQPTITLGVRCLETERAILYEIDEEFDGEQGLSVGVDAALSFGESLGFLFDDDSLEQGGDEARHEALELWQELLEPLEVEGPEDRVARASDGAAIQGGEATPPHGDPVVEGSTPATAAPSPSPPLTKFRNVHPPPPEPKPKRAPRAALARVRLVKRAENADRGDGIGRLLRLLSSY